MTELSDAAERLMWAVDRLEAAFRRRGALERQAQDEHEAADGVTEEVRDRLDGVIERLRSALGS